MPHGDKSDVDFQISYMANVDKSGTLHICHVETFQIPPHDRYIWNYPHQSGGEIWNFSTSIMCVMFRIFPPTLWFESTMCTICGVLSQFRLFCCNLRCFVAICALLCGEKRQIWGMKKASLLVQDVFPYQKNEHSIGALDVLIWLHHFLQIC